MSRFYGILQGNRGRATRQGSPASGITARAQGWHLGGEVFARDMNGEDVIEVSITGGSGTGFAMLNLGTYKLVDGKPVKIA